MYVILLERLDWQVQAAMASGNEEVDPDAEREAFEEALRAPLTTVDGEKYELMRALGVA